ncbi:regulation of the phosphate regulon [Synechocystis sp. PCC 6803]|uniref:histidine kinase n=1 Tax=Synechocystis sp. (strain ATCC 27184 / PCC 6803 / Kazusa) TaxID=1111708 RepID=Q55586_SYNY3|nr:MULTISPECIES: PAS domain-containing sensor histidine kinase [unclassified Synechocystis]BAM54569.1 regulation of the phosphate regulon [Synechocystis sp. PCC 6803] [Bacillus subtilis BEST7613]AGF52386.1 regulation of the phosphate regulon [Synechocystis sp. PCC 6803]ALJ68326.1 ATPase [Synechocystis sp. PCC 6803]AVP90165.1 ATPase [Synechocystis sp. IPPAS B-1465]MCW5241299.1 ATPase [Synechocystis sp. PCC 6803]
MEIITLAIGGAIGFGIGAIERFRLNNKIKKLLTGLPDTQEVSHSLSLVSLVRREINHLNDLCAEYLDTIAHWRGVMSLSPLGYLLIDQENNLEWCNPAAESLLHIRYWQPGERRLFLEFIRSYELDQLIECTRQTQTNQTREWSFFPPLTAAMEGWGNHRPLTPESILLRGSGFPLKEGKVAVFVENRQTLAALRQGRDQAFSDLAHELRTPLTAVALIAERLQARLPAEDGDWAERLLKEISRLQNLVESWLHLTQITANPNLYLEPEPINLRHLLAITWERLTPIAVVKNITLDYQGPTKLNLEGDGDRLMQVLMNILDNTLKYSPPEGTIFVQGHQGTEGITMIIRDQGLGFQPRDLPYIFERLYRGDSSRARLHPDSQRHGSGLGLAIAKEIVLAHRGNLTAANHETGGAMFTIELPYEPNMDENP